MEGISKSKFIRDARCTNDVSWYKNYETLTKDVASVFMSRPNGVDYPPLLLGTNTSTTTRSQKQGGVLINRVIPWYGSSQHGNVPVSATALNTAASKLYYYVVHGNSRNVSYDKGDLMRVLMTYDSIYCALHEAIRAYKLIKLVRVENKWASSLLRYLSWDPDDLKANVVQFRTQINLAIQRLNQLSLPDIFAMHKCHAELFDYVYRDRPGEKSQYMANVPAGFWMYFDEYSSLDCVHQYKVGQNTVKVTDTGRTVADFTHYINFMLHTIYDSTDMGVIQADIRKAFQNNNFITMYMLEEDPDVPIVFDEEYNLKVHNMEVFGYPDDETFTPVVETQVNSVKSLGVIHDMPNGDPNMITMLAYDDVNSGIPKDESRGNWRLAEYTDSVHVMDLPDEYREDVDSVLLMQTMKTSGGLITKGYWHVGDAGMRNVCYPEAGAVIVAGSYYYGDLSSGLSNYYPVPTGKHNATSVSSLANVAEAITSMHMMWEMGVTIPSPVMITDGTNYYRLKPQLEVENVTVYSNDVLRNILNVIVESLWYASELYNGTK